MCKKDVKQDKVSMILSSMMSIQSLDFTNAEDRRVALDCLAQRPSLITLLREDDPNQLSIMIAAVRKNYSAILYINDRAPHKKLLEAFLIGRTKAEKSTRKNDFDIIKSYDNHLLFVLDYATCAGEQVSYFDTELRIPNSLSVKATIKFKLMDTQKLFESIDLALDHTNEAAIYNFLSQMVTTAFRTELYNMMDNESMGFYSIAGKYEEIMSKVKDRLTEKCDRAGLIIAELLLKSVDIPEETSRVLENEYFILAKSERKQIRDQKVNEMALENYERKAAIHNKYPEFPMTLTEAEKDKAFERYLLKTGRKVNEGEIAPKEKLKERVVGKLSTQINIKQETATEEKRTKHKLVYILVCCLGLLVSCLSFIGSTIAGFTLLGATFLYAGIALAVAYPKIFYKKRTLNQEDERVEQAAAMVQENSDNNLM